jgi:hypothetical protein
VSRRDARFHRPAQHGPGELQRPVVSAEPDRTGTHRRPVRHAAVAQLRSTARNSAARVPPRAAQLRVCERPGPRSDAHPYSRQRLPRLDGRHRPSRPAVAEVVPGPENDVRQPGDPWIWRTRSRLRHDRGTDDRPGHPGQQHQWISQLCGRVLRRPRRQNVRPRLVNSHPLGRTPRTGRR